MKRGGVFSLIAFVLIGCSNAQARMWTDAAGKYVFEAELLGIEPGGVRLKVWGHEKPCVVPLRLLSKADRQYVQKLVAKKRRTESEADLGSKPTILLPPHARSGSAPEADDPRIEHRNIRSHVHAMRSFRSAMTSQQKAKRALEALDSSEVARSDLFRIKKNAAKRFPYDYRAQLNEVIEQAEAYASLRRYVNNQLPKDVFMRVKQAIAEAHPDDYATQWYAIRFRIRWYVEEDRRKHPNVRPLPQRF